MKVNVNMFLHFNLAACMNFCTDSTFLFYFKNVSDEKIINFSVKQKEKAVNINLLRIITQRS